MLRITTLDHYHSHCGSFCGSALFFPSQNLYNSGYKKKSISVQLDLKRAHGFCSIFFFCRSTHANHDKSHQKGPLFCAEMEKLSRFLFGHFFTSFMFATVKPSNDVILFAFQLFIDHVHSMEPADSSSHDLDEYDYFFVFFLFAVLRSIFVLAVLLVALPQLLWCFQRVLTLKSFNVEKVLSVSFVCLNEMNICYDDVIH